jgi:hypothetical protein
MLFGPGELARLLFCPILSHLTNVSGIMGIRSFPDMPAGIAEIRVCSYLGIAADPGDRLPFPLVGKEPVAVFAGAEFDIGNEDYHSKPYQAQEKEDADKGRRYHHKDDNDSGQDCRRNQKSGKAAFGFAHRFKPSHHPVSDIRHILTWLSFDRVAAFSDM